LPSGSSCPPGPSLADEPSEELSDEVSEELSVPGVSDGEADDALALAVSGELWSPDWTLSVSGPPVVSGDFVTACFTACFAPLLCVLCVADAMAEPPRARAASAAAAPIVVFNRLRMVSAPWFGVMSTTEARGALMTGG
jgi:hypothetical protein